MAAIPSTLSRDRKSESLTSTGQRAHGVKHPTVKCKTFFRPQEAIQARKELQIKMPLTNQREGMTLPAG